MLTKRLKKPRQKRNKSRLSETKDGLSTKPLPAPPSRTCEFCLGPAHQGGSEESLASLAVLNPEAAVFYDRDVASTATVSALCGPRFRQNEAGLHAHYGNVAAFYNKVVGARYVVYKWSESKRWEKIIDVGNDDG